MSGRPAKSTFIFLIPWTQLISSPRPSPHTISITHIYLLKARVVCGNGKTTSTKPKREEARSTEATMQALQEQSKTRTYFERPLSQKYEFQRASKKSEDGPRQAKSKRDCLTSFSTLTWLHRSKFTKIKQTTKVIGVVSWLHLRRDTSIWPQVLSR